MVLLQALLNGVLVGAIWVILGLGKQLVLGVIHFVNFAHGHLVLVGMYLTFTLWSITAIDPLVLVPIVTALMFCFGIFLNWILTRHLVRRNEQAQMIGTLALALIIQSVALMVYSPQPRSISIWWADSAFRLGALYVNWGQFAGLLIASIAFALTWWFIRRTPLGVLIRATSQNREVAQYMGIKVGRVYAVAFAISVALAGLVGAVLMISMPVDPTTAWSFLVIMFVVPVLGGMGSIPGTAIAGLMVGIVQVLTSTFVDIQLQNAAVYIIFLVFLTVRPQGLLGKTTDQRRVSV